MKASIRIEFAPKFFVRGEPCGVAEGIRIHVGDTDLEQRLKNALYGIAWFSHDGHSSADNEYMPYAYLKTGKLIQENWPGNIHISFFYKADATRGLTSFINDVM